MSPEPESSREVANPHLSAVRVLVVDDYPGNAECLAVLLRLFGYDVTTAFDGPGALRAAQVRQPDVVLLDISMPGMNGYEVARHLRRMFGETVLLIALTALSSEEDRQRCFQAGLDYHLVKPADPDEIERLIKEMLGALR